MRGLQRDCDAMSSTLRYNPAYAGTTLFRDSSSIERAIQPRVCGDYQATPFVINKFIDTTPRMRGLLVSRGVQWLPVRYNPAYAGTTVDFIVDVTIFPIQPRVCGDYSCAPCRVAVRCDTTPRMRGLRAFRVEFRDGAGYNPAYAGTTAFSYGALVVKSIQPRVCGDYLSLVSYSAFWSDTTPRMRGLPQPWCP